MPAKGSCCCSVPGIGPPPWCTIKAYSNVTPWNVVWVDTRLTNNPTFSPALEGAVAQWGSDEVVSLGKGNVEEWLLVRAADDGTRGIESSDGGFTYPGLGTTLRGWIRTDGSTILYSGPAILTGGLHAAFDGSLAQQDQRFAIGTNITSIELSGADIILGRQASDDVLRKLDESGATIDSLARTSLSVTGGRSLGNPISGYIAPDGTLFAFGYEAGLGFWRRYWSVDATLSETGATSGALILTAPSGTAVGDWIRASRMTATHFFWRWSTGEFVCVDVATRTELWTLTSIDEVFLAIDADYVYTGNMTSGILSARDVADGSVDWTLSTSIAGDAYGKFLSGGYMALLRQGSSGTVRIIDVSSGTLITTLDIAAVDIVEVDGHYITVGPYRTTSV